ncbi:hypothetical protein [Hyphomicrobium sp.]|uniref:hypothetical protein n=1 Tax=Hyphomicrobium sp. TaxID=82 RepID=UPI0025BD311F|nr:hypothetical protein [Hyphomicrobium sp.]MCC7253941.1 hypothetical protein [Hyphomicrobium sp.]
MSKRSFLAIVCAIAVVMPLTSAEAQRSRDDWRPDNRTDWELLGTAQIGTRLERDVIEVGRREGRFQSLGFTVTGGDARIEDLKIVYGGGESEELRVREVFKAGTRSRPIDLGGRGGSFIQRIEITYRAFGPVKIEFYGEKRREVAQWAQLGCQRVGFLETKDQIRVGRREGAFRALKLQVSDGTLRLNRLRVLFTDRTSQVLDVRAAIPKGTETRAIDLDGRRRTIERIELEYLPSLNLKKGPEVCVLALEAGGPGFGPGGGGPRR